PAVRLLHPVEANELFVAMPPHMIAGLRQSGFVFYDWPGEPEDTIRLVTAFNTETTHVELFLKTVSDLASRAA
ncbi:MAG TPA: low specificity L-threonine aldolase, partial [Dongiaceae bacterium]|nr:low specificity L-threonine aldolase [Dongiaceae bacterium]